MHKSFALRASAVGILVLAFGTSPSGAASASQPLGSQEFMGRAAAEWIAQLRDSEDDGARVAAVAALASIGPEPNGVVEALIAALADASALVRAGASRSLGGFGAEVAPALIEALEHDSDAGVRAGVAPILGSYVADGADVMPAVSEALRNDDDAGVRIAAARGLSVAGAAAADAVPVLIEALEDAVPEVRQWAAIALGRIGPAAREAVPALQEAVADENRMAANAARSALRQIQR